MTDLTPNLKLELIPANTKTWTDRGNQNWTLIDAAVGAYFTLQNLQGIWENSHAYTAGQTVVDGATAAVWTCQVAHTSAGIPTTFAQERAANSTFWSVYSSPARARGIWEPSTSYAVNDFVVNSSQYAVCIATHMSSTNFDNDVASGYWSILIDLSQVGSQVLPVLSGLADANKFVITNSSGTGYNIFDVAATLGILGATSFGIAVLQASSTAAARSAINAQEAGSYQNSSAYLSAISGLSVSANTLPYINGSSVAATASITSFGRNLIDDANAAAGRTTLGLGTAAIVNTGTSSGNVPVLDGSGDLAVGVIPAIDLTTMVTGVLPRANGGFTPSQLTNSLSADVTLNNIAQYFDGPSVAQGTDGTWFASGSISIGAPSGQRLWVKLWDGTTVIASAAVTLNAANHATVISLSGYITSPAGNIRISARNPDSGCTMTWNSSGNEKDCTITAFRIG